MLTGHLEWQWDQLRVMKVGGNESATKFFQSHGGSAALASKDVKTKYTSGAAVKYKEELKRRADADAQEYVLFDCRNSEKLADNAHLRYPNDVVITEVTVSTPSNGSDSPAGEQEDDFFSSWDKPAIKRPSNPPSRTSTPPVSSRTGSPFLNANANGNGSRPKSPLSASENNEKNSTSPPPPVVRTGQAVRKGPAAGGAKKGGVLGTKKGPKLGAKKVAGSDTIDFDEAEKKAKEEAERIAKLGYDPEAEKAEAEARTKIVSPTPVSPRSSSGAATKGHERSASEIERLGMGVGKLGFGQVGKPKAPAPKKLGFGATSSGSGAPAQDGRFISLIFLNDLIGANCRTSRRRTGTRAFQIRRPKGHIIG